MKTTIIGVLCGIALAYQGVGIAVAGAFALSPTVRGILPGLPYWWHDHFTFGFDLMPNYPSDTVAWTFVVVGTIMCIAGSTLATRRFGAVSGI